MSENRDYRIHLRMSEEEKKKLKAALSQIETKSLSTYIHKMAIEGSIIHLQMPELTEVVSQLHEKPNNSNQIAAQVNSAGCIYALQLNQIA